MEQLIAKYKEDIRATETTFLRYLHNEIAWDTRLVALLGSRGVGKSTLVKQHIKLYDDLETTLYVSADDLYFTSHTLVELAERFYREGGLRLYIDEIHKYEGWSREIKNIYDRLPGLQLVYTGSSILELEKGGADLSRRKLEYHLSGMSFREFLELGHGIKVPAASLDDVLKGKVALPKQYRPLKYFKQYLQQGYYPFFREPGYNTRLQAVVDRALEVDIPQFARYTVSTARKLRRLLYIIAQSVPFKPNMDKISKMVEMSRNDLKNIFIYFEKAGLLNQLRADTQGIRLLGKVDKVYLNDTNLSYALSETEPNVGNLRETFFMAATSVKYPVVNSSTADFEIGEYTFEVGGRKKGEAQITGTPNTFIVKDDIETAARHTLPLWTFGILY